MNNGSNCYGVRGKGGNVTSAGWQVTLCDPMWHVSSRSGVATLRTAIRLLLTYLLTKIQVIGSINIFLKKYNFHWQLQIKHANISYSDLNIERVEKILNKSYYTC